MKRIVGVLVLLLVLSGCTTMPTIIKPTRSREEIRSIVTVEINRFLGWMLDRRLLLIPLPMRGSPVLVHPITLERVPPRPTMITEDEINGSRLDLQIFKDLMHNSPFEEL